MNIGGRSVGVQTAFMLESWNGMTVACGVNHVRLTGGVSEGDRTSINCAYIMSFPA